MIDVKRTRKKLKLKMKLRNRIKIKWNKLIFQKRLFENFLRLLYFTAVFCSSQWRNREKQWKTIWFSLESWGGGEFSWIELCLTYTRCRCCEYIFSILAHKGACVCVCVCFSEHDKIWQANRAAHRYVVTHRMSFHDSVTRIDEIDWFNLKYIALFWIHWNFFCFVLVWFV